MTAGELTDRVNVLKRSETTDGQGGRPVTWVDLVTASATALTPLFAAVRPAGGGEKLQAASIGAQNAYLVWINYRADVTEKMRALWRPYRAAVTKTLEIHRVRQAEDGGRQWLVLECGEVV